MSTHKITEPLRLAVGPHKAGSGKGCAMNVVSWENGDATITDLPDCADPMLARVVQRVNDRHCTRRDGDLLCAPCSVEVLALAHRTVGTALTDWSPEDRRRLYVRLALDEAESVARPDEDERVTRCRAVVAAWLAGAATVDEVGQARRGVRGAAYATSTAYAADTATDDFAAYAADSAAAAVRADPALLARAHALIDRFLALTGVTPTPVAPEATARAVEQMLATR
jgi:hypothetical protein